MTRRYRCSTRHTHYRCTATRPTAQAATPRHEAPHHYAAFATTVLLLLLTMRIGGLRRVRAILSLLQRLLLFALRLLI